MKPLISVILTSFNHGKFLSEAINSVLEQSFTHFELIIIDDCSVDSSWELINTFQDPRIVKLRNTKRRNAVFGINKGIMELAQGEYISIHHSDDVFCLNKLETQLHFLEGRDDIGAVFTRAAFVDENSNYLEGIAGSNNVFDVENRSRFEWLNHFFYKGNCICHPSVLIRKSCYDKTGPYDFRLGSLPDFDMWIRFCLQFELQVLPERLIKFRVLPRGQNTSGDKPATYIRSLNELGQVYSHYLKLTDLVDFNRVFPDQFMYTAAENEDIPFVLAMRAVYTKEDSVYAMALKIFGLNLLYNLFKEEGYRKRMLDKYKFDSNDLMELSSTIDVYNWRSSVYGDSIRFASCNKPLNKFLNLIKKITRYT